MPNQYRVKGAFFEKDNAGPNGPAFTGFVEIDGVRTNIALWPKTSQGGTNYFQVSEDKKKQPGQASTVNKPFKSGTPFGPKPTVRPPDDDPDDGIPF